MLTFGRIKLRASDFIWYALLIASLPARLGSALYPCVVCCLLAVAFAAFYAPFAGLRIRRPLPFATAAAVPALVIGALCGEGFARAVCAGVF